MNINKNKNTSNGFNSSISASAGISHNFGIMNTNKDENIGNNFSAYDSISITGVNKNKNINNRLNNAIIDKIDENRKK